MKKNRVFSIACASLLSLSLLAGCGAPDDVDGTKVALSVDGEELSMGTYAAAVRYEQASSYDYSQNMMASYQSAGQTLTMSVWDEKLPDESEEDKSGSEETEESDGKTDDEQESTSDTVGGNEAKDKSEEKPSGLVLETYGDQLLDTVARNLASYMAMEKHMEEYGVSLSDEDKSKISEVAEKYIENSGKDVMKKNGIVQADMERYLTFMLEYSLMEKAYAEKADIKISEEESKCMKLSYVAFYAEESDSSSDSNSNAGLDAAKAQADAFLEYLNAREDKSTVDFQTLLDENAAFSSGYAGSESVAINDSEESNYIFSKETIQKLLEQEDGTVYAEAVTADSNTVVFVFRTDKAYDEDGSKEYAEALKAEQASSEFSDLIKTWKKDCDVKFYPKELAKVIVKDSIVYTGTKPAEEDKESGSGDSPDVSTGGDSSGSDAELGSDTEDGELGVEVIDPNTTDASESSDSEE